MICVRFIFVEIVSKSSNAKRTHLNSKWCCFFNFLIWVSNQPITPQNGMWHACFLCFYSFSCFHFLVLLFAQTNRKQLCSALFCCLFFFMCVCLSLCFYVLIQISVFSLALCVFQFSCPFCWRMGYLKSTHLSLKRNVTSVIVSSFAMFASLRWFVTLAFSEITSTKIDLVRYEARVLPRNKSKPYLHSTPL